MIFQKNNLLTTENLSFSELLRTVQWIAEIFCFFFNFWIARKFRLMDAKFPFLKNVHGYPGNFCDSGYPLIPAKRELTIVLQYLFLHVCTAVNIYVAYHPSVYCTTNCFLLCDCCCMLSFSSSYVCVCVCEAEVS